MLLDVVSKFLFRNHVIFSIISLSNFGRGVISRLQDSSVEDTREMRFFGQFDLSSRKIKDHTEKSHVLQLTVVSLQKRLGRSLLVLETESLSWAWASVWFVLVNASIPFRPSQTEVEVLP